MTFYFNNYSHFIFTIPILYILIFSIQSLLLKNSLLNYVNSYDTSTVVSQKIVRCSYNILNTDVAYVELENDEYIGDDYGIYFYFLENIFNIKNNDWTKNYIGATDPKNTTFPELVEMVKEDCGQFQGGFVNEDSDGIHWSHTRAETNDEKANYIRNYGYFPIGLHKDFIAIYGDMDEMSDDEVIALDKKIKEEGLHEKIKIIEEANDLHKELSEISDKQRNQIINKYGNWGYFSNEEFLDWIEVIKVDMESGEFVLSEE